MTAVESGGWPRNENKTGGRDTVDRLAKDVWYGNGKPGLCTRMDMAEKDINIINVRDEKRSKKQDRIELAVWAAVAIAIANLLLQHFH